MKIEAGGIILEGKGLPVNIDEMKSNGNTPGFPGAVIDRSDPTRNNRPSN
jgi:hypothetical protein